MAKTFYIETHGCQMNVHDSEKIGGLLVHRGMTPVSTVDEADLFILNTCSVREKAAQKVYSRLGQLRPRKKKDPNFLVGVVGCVAQQEREEMVNKVPFVDLVVGTHLYHTIPDLLDERLVQTNPSVKIPHTVMANFLEADEPVEISQVQRNDRVRAAVTIMEGCNKRCAFCIVPQTRGRERNRPARLILDEIRRALDQGYPEIQLLGQTVNSYRDPEKRLYKFADLLAETASLEGLRRLRFTSPHPRHFSDDVISVIAEHETICNHVHLPLQSGSTRILRRMRRQHDREWYENLVEKFRTCGRRIALSTDMIVGFPGESDQDRSGMTMSQSK
jgi:tRNA-2-methylthio-N6-dimethylallyladenosine synthase